MLIEETDLTVVLKRVRDAYDWGLFTVMSPLGYAQPKDFRFCSNHYDIALFYHDHPFDSDQYKGYDVRDVYEAAVMLRRGQPEVIDFSRRANGANNTLYDLDKLMGFRYAERELADTLAKFNWKPHWGAPTVESKLHLPDDELWQVLGRMEQLAASEMGRSRMARLWEAIVPAIYTRPYFLEEGDRLGDIVLGATRLATKDDKQPPVRRIRPPNRRSGPRL